MSLWSELRRRHIFRIAAVYAATGWLVLQLGAIIFPALHAPEWALPLLIGFVALGFPVALVLAWAFEMTPEGVRRTTDAGELGAHALEMRRRMVRTLNAAIIVMLAAAVGVLAWRLTIRSGARIGNVSLTAARPAATGVPAPAAASAASANAIAVLPFLNLSPKPEMAYFAEGISEQLLDTLAQETNLQVVARTSALQFKNRPKDIREIGKALDVRYVLDGSVRRNGGQIRVSVQLIDARTGYQEWSHTYQRTVGDVFRIQDEITRAVAMTLNVEIPSASTIAKENPSTSMGAYDEYLLGQQLLNRRETESLRAALTHFKKATERDPKYGPAFAQVAIVYTLLSSYSYGNYTTAEIIKLGKPFLVRAVALAPDAPDTLAAQGRYLDLTEGPAAALPYYERAARENPSYMDAVNWKIGALVALGQLREANAATVAAARRDPLNWIINENYMSVLLDQGRFDAARAVAERFLTIDAGHGHQMLGDIAMADGKEAEAMRQYLEALTIRPKSQSIIGAVVTFMAFAGLGDDAYRLWKARGGPMYGGLVAAWTGHPKVALEEMQALLRREGDKPAANVTAAEVAIRLGRRADAKRYFDEAWKLSNGQVDRLHSNVSSYDLLSYAALLLESGESEKAETLFARVRADAARAEAARAEAARSAIGEPADNASLFELAGVDVLTGNRERGLAALGQLVRQATMRDPSFYFALVPESLKRAPQFDAVRDDPRFQAIVEKAKRRQARLRARILPVLCGWDFTKLDWRPQPATCEGVVEGTAAATSP